MLTDSEFDNWCCRQRLEEASRKTIEIIRCSEPSRHVGGGRRNVSGRYPSHKMGVTIQFESHKVELPFIYQLEHDCDVLEFYDQPPPIKLSYQSEDGRNRGFYITPDFFVLRENSAGWVECKTEDQLQELASKSPNRYVLGQDNQWHTPSGERYAEQLGFYFRLWSNVEIDWALHRNLEFSEDYYRSECYPVAESAINTVVSLVSAQPGITLAELLHHAQRVSPDEIYFMIVYEEIFVDLTASSLVEPARCLVFRDQQSARAYSLIALSQATADIITSPVIDIVAGTSVDYDGKTLTIALVGETSILLHKENKEPLELDLTAFENLVRLGKITSKRAEVKGGLSAEAMELFKKASEHDLKEANRRYRLIEPYLGGQLIRTNTEYERSIRNWLAAYRKAQQQYGYGYLGLIHFDHAKGNRSRKLPQYTLEQIEKFISEDYETKKQKRKYEVYAAFVEACSQAGIPVDQIPSYKTFINEIKRREGYSQTLKRSGHRAAYQLESFYWELELTTPRHGDFPLHICHVDHTQSDVELRCSRTGRVLGRAWITFLVDAFTRRILAVYASYDPPSYRSCMMVLRICVQRHGRLPQIVVTDNGKEFHSTYFETLLALFECTLKHRPAAKSRFSAVCERLFGTTNTQFLYNLAGNTQITKKVRLMTKSVNPKGLALWTLGLLYLYLCEWAYEVYDTTQHPALEGQSPLEAFAAGIAQYGSRSHKWIPYDENFRILTSPTTAQGKAKVQPGQGVKIEYKYYWSNTFRDPEVENTWVDVRYEPFNAGIAYAYVLGQWVECISEHYALFRGRSEKEIQLASAQLNKRNQNHTKNYRVRAKQLGQFLASTEACEVLLEQRLRDAQAQEVFQVIDGGLPNLNPYSQSQVTNTDDDKDERHSPTQLERNEPIESNKLKLFKSY